MYQEELEKKQKMFCMLEDGEWLEEILRKVELRTIGHSIVGAKFSSKGMKRVITIITTVKSSSH